MNKCEGCNWYESWDCLSRDDLVDRACPCGNCLVKVCCSRMCRDGLDWLNESHVRYRKETIKQKQTQIFKEMLNSLEFD